MEVTAARLSDILHAATDEFHRIAALGRDVRHKADGSLVTSVDLGINRLLRAQLARAAPQAGWLSEESPDDEARVPSRWLWVVDPLDGTKEYARGVPEFAMSIGLVEDDRIRAGGVANPMSGVGAAAGTDGSWSSWPTPARDQDNRAGVLAQAVASVSRSETEDGSVLPYIDLVGNVRPVGSVANKLLRVACGLDDLTFSVQPKSIWDVCGGIALLEARGMVFCRLDGAANGFNRNSTRIHSGFVAGPKVLVEPLLAQISERMFARGQDGRR